MRQTTGLRAARGLAVAALVVAALGLPLSDMRAASAGAFDGRWFGRGEKDICGNPWAAEFTVERDKLKGRFWRGKVLYNVYGQVDPQGQLVSVRTGRDRREHGVIGARFLTFELMFDAPSQSAEGNYGVLITGGAASCETPIALQRSLDG